MNNIFQNVCSVVTIKAVDELQKNGILVNAFDSHIFKNLCIRCTLDKFLHHRFGMFFLFQLDVWVKHTLEYLVYSEWTDENWNHA